MSEKQAKRQRQEAVKQGVDLIASITFSRNPQGSVDVSGNIANPIATFDIIGKGCLALAQYYANLAQQKASRIVPPDPELMAKLITGGR